MNRKKKWIALTLALVLAAGLALGGCANAQTPGEGVSSASGTGTVPITVTVEAPPETGTSLYPQGTLRACMLADGCRSLMNYDSTQTTRRYYELVPRPELDKEIGLPIYNLVYIDFVTRQQATLCSEAGCAHDHAGCTAYVKGDTRLLEAGGKLVLIQIYRQVRAGGDEETGELGEVLNTIPGSVTVRDLDGSNATVLLDSTENFEIDWLTDDTYIYGIRETPAPEGGDPNYGKQRHLFRLNLESGETEDLHELEPLRCFPIGTLNGKILLRNIAYPKPNRGLTGAEWEANEEAARYQFITVNPATGTAETLEKDLSAWNEGGVYETDGYFYFSRRTGSGTAPALYRLNLETFEETKVLEGPEGHTYGVWQTSGGKIIYSGSKSTVQPDGSTQQEDTGHFWLNPATGETAPLALSVQHESDWGNGPLTFTDPVLPMADAGEYFLVTSDISGSNEQWVYQRSLILKEDYWAGQANYIPITVV